MAYKPRFGSRQREATWQCEALAAYKAGRGQLPICNLCDLPVEPTQAWDRSHAGAPRSLGGKSVGVAHLLCNRLDGQQIVVPMVAKAERVRKRHFGITGPGLGKYPMKAGKRSSISKTVRGQVVSRLTGAQKHARAMRKRAILTQQGT